MNVFLLILAGLLLLIVLLLFCPVVVKIVYHDKVRVKVGYLFPVFTIPLEKKEETDPKKIAKQAERQRRKEEKKQRREEKKKLKQQKEVAEGETAEEPKGNFVLNKIKSKGLGGLIELLKELVRIVGYLLKKITDHLVISKMDLQVAIATEDAAQTALNCGYACSAVFPLLAFIEQHVKKCRHREQIYPVFTQTETKVDFVLKARIMPFFIVSGLLGSLLKALKALAK